MQQGTLGRGSIRRWGRRSGFLIGIELIVQHLGVHSELLLEHADISFLVVFVMGGYRCTERIVRLGCRALGT
jgi:hypothetical protein